MQLTSRAKNIYIADQTTRPINSNLCRSLGGPYMLSNNVIPGSYTLNLIDASTLSVSNTIGIFQDSNNPATYFANITDISINTLTLDTPLDINFDLNKAVVYNLDCNMNKDGSSTPLIYTINNISNIDIDITSIIIHITDGADMDDGKFGGISALTNGIVLRKKRINNTYWNIFNVKTNGDLSELTYDKNYDTKAPAGVYGFKCRLNFSGQDKMGVVIRLKKNEELQLIIQDDLTDLTKFVVTAIGHFTDTIIL